MKSLTEAKQQLEVALTEYEQASLAARDAHQELESFDAEAFRKKVRDALKRGGGE